MKYYLGPAEWASMRFAAHALRQRGEMTKQENLAENWFELARRANYSVVGVASLCGLSVRQLERKIRRTQAQSAKHLLSVLRLRAAWELLEEGVSVKSAAYTLGYKRPEHLSRDFKNLFRVSPSRVRREVE